MKEELGVNLTDSKFFKEYSGNSFYNPKLIYNNRVYITTIEGEVKPDAEIEDFIWFSKEDFKSKKYPMITITEEQIIPDLIKAKIW